MKKILYFATAALALSACSSDDFLGEDRPNLGGAEELAISFGSKTAAVTRAGGATAAATLGNSFVVYGYKTNPDQTVYDHYTVNFKDGSALSTESNSAGWEYVGQTLNQLSTLTGEQSIKYWDFAADSYDFIAFSLGTATQVATDKATGDYVDGDVAISKVNTTPQYTITGKIADIAKVYIADRVTAKNITSGKVANRLVGYKDPVQFNFHAATSKVRMGIYETIPGYSVKEVKFYAMGTSEAEKLEEAKQAPTLFASAATIANSSDVVTATVTFPNTTVTSPDYNKAVLTLPDGAKSKNMTFGSLSVYGAEHKEAAGEYIGRASDASNVSMCDYVNVFPCNAGALTLKVDYTLVSRDGSGETINVVGATATVPAAYGNWKPNYAYTYIFKISDNTNGAIGGEVGLYPITLDAIVTDTEEGLQETITTVATPSITTYAKGEMVTANNEYLTGANIYVAVNGATLSSSNSKLYTATQAKVSGSLEAAQGITEESVANAIANDQDGTPGAPYVVTDANNWSLTVATASGLTEASSILATDAPDGNAITGSFMKFTPSAAGHYVFEYTADATHKYYKVIEVVAP